MVADLYVRVSTDEQADKGYSQRDQEERLRLYCVRNGIEIRDVIYEDHSAKSFKRPEWQKLLSKLKNKRGQTNLILFTKWDRFSRNAGDAYQMISILKRLGVEPQAIEQPLDMTIPENKMMLAIYLSAPEVENDRRALNVFHGMRRAKKEGRWMGTAPVGYTNKVTEDGKQKYIAIRDDEGSLLRWAFEQILENTYNTEQIWKLVREKAGGKGRFSKNNFWVALRNPLYCGKIFVPPYGKEEGYFVKGQHEPLISEQMFNEVQEILEGRKRVIKPKIVSVDNLPLRGFLKCPNCERMLTGSASRGKMGNYYYYYHCTSKCGTRFKAVDTNRIFSEQLGQLIPKPGMIEVFVESMKHEFSRQIQQQNTERKRLLDELEKLNSRIQKARIQKVEGILDDEDFFHIKKETNERIERIENQLGQLATNFREIDDLFETAAYQLYNLRERYENGTSEEQRMILGSIFPEKIVFDGTQHRTPRVNEVIKLIYQKTSVLEGNKKGTNLSFVDLSQEVIRLGLEPRTPTLKVLCSTS